MLKTWIAIAFCFATASIAQAANITVPGSYATIQAAINAANDGDTITLTNSATFQEDLVIAKRLDIVAAAGQTPVIQCGKTRTDAQLVFNPGADGTRFGSLSGGRITLQYRKQALSSSSFYTGMILFDHTTGTQVTLTNLDVNEVADAGVTPTTTSLATTVIIHGQIPNIVNLAYCNFDASRTFYTNSIVQNHFLRLGNEWNATPYATRLGGPTYNLFHVRYKNYMRAGILPNFKDARINISYSDCGVTVGDLVGGSASRPWGSVYSGRLDAPWSGSFDHSIFRGAGGSNNVWLSSNGTSVTMTWCVLLSKYISTDPNNTYGNLYFGTNGNGTAGAGVCNVTADHCDFVDLTTLSATYYAPICRPATVTTGLTVKLAITNSNIYASTNAPVCVTLATSDTLTSDFNNVFGPKASTGYTAGPNDTAWDPMYYDAAAGDLRYLNHTLSTRASSGGPIGVNADYTDPPSGIIFVPIPQLNAARNWTSLK
ncbi:MAG: hypothetical protein ABFD69_02340 [Candidatus Sumerlaeia bacterium]